MAAETPDAQNPDSEYPELFPEPLIIGGPPEPAPAPKSRRSTWAKLLAAALLGYLALRALGIIGGNGDGAVASLEAPTTFLEHVANQRYDEAVALSHPRCALTASDLSRIFQSGDITYQLTRVTDISTNSVTIDERDRRRSMVTGTLTIDGVQEPGIAVSMWLDDSDWKVCSVEIADPALDPAD